MEETYRSYKAQSEILASDVTLVFLGGSVRSFKPNVPMPIIVSSSNITQVSYDSVSGLCQKYPRSDPVCRLANSDSSAECGWVALRQRSLQAAAHPGVGSLSGRCPHSQHGPAHPRQQHRHCAVHTWRHDRLHHCASMCVLASSWKKIYIFRHPTAVDCLVRFTLIRRTTTQRDAIAGVDVGLQQSLH